MNEMTIRLDRNGAAAVPGGQLLLGYAGNRGNYRLRIEQRGEWKGLTVCAHWHTPGASAATLVENGILTVPAAVTAVPGAGCLTFEGTDGSRTVTSADVRCKVCPGQLPAAHRAAGRVEGADRVRPLAHPRRKRGYAGGKRNPDRTGGGDGSARRGLPHL